MCISLITVNPIIQYWRTLKELFAPNKPSILIIEDDSSILRTLGKIFQRKGYLVTLVAKGSEAVEKMNNACFDVALIDFRLPTWKGPTCFL